MIPFNLWYAEWLKTVRRPFYQILLLIMLSIVVAFFLVISVGAMLDPPRFRPLAMQIVPFPQCLTTIAEVAVIVGQLLAAVFVAQSIGSEYSQDTWKMILPRHGARLAFLVLKIGIAGLGMLIVLLSMHVIGLLLSTLASALLGLHGTQTADSRSAPELLRSVAVTLLPMLLYGSVALCATIGTRSTIGGALISFFGLQTLALLSPFFGPAARLLPYPHLPNVIEHWVFRDAATLRQIDHDFGMPVAPWLSVVVVLGYCALAVLSAGIIFWKRDMHGE